MVVPQLKQVILFTSITSTIGTIQLFDEVVNITAGGPSNATMTASQYIYNHSFVYSANFGYSAAMSWVVVVIVAALSMIQFVVTRAVSYTHLDVYKRQEGGKRRRGGRIPGAGFRALRSQ